tara:strand:+ start:487 stop:1029 length:543 start_codon:yes stop_codon:yes gene_type:complete
MKDNYRKALLKAQISTIKPPKRTNLPKAQYQDANVGNTSGGQLANVNTDRVVTPQTRERSWLGRLGTRIGNIFRPDWRDLNPYETKVDPNTRKNIKTYQFNDDWGNQQQTTSGGMIDPNVNTDISGETTGSTTSPGTLWPGSTVYKSDPTKSIWPGDNAQIGKETYMQALKAYKKGGQKK